MRTPTLRSLLPLALAACAALSALAGDPPDATLPFNPIDGAREGDWAHYRVIDPSKPGEQLPAERLTVQSVESAAVVVAGSSGDRFRYKPGDDGRSTLAYLRGFFGEARDAQLADLRAVAVNAEAVEVGGRRYEATRVDAEIISKVTAAQGGGLSGEMRSRFRIWIARGLRAGGVVRAEATVDLGGKTHRGVLELEAHGSAADPPPGPAGPTPTAEPRGAGRR